MHCKTVHFYTNSYHFRYRAEYKPYVVVHSFNFSIWEIESGVFQVLGQPGLHSEIVRPGLRKTKQNRTENTDISKRIEISLDQRDP